MIAVTNARPKVSRGAAALARLAEVNLERDSRLTQIV